MSNLVNDNKHKAMIMYRFCSKCFIYVNSGMRHKRTV